MDTGKCERETYPDNGASKASTPQRATRMSLQASGPGGTQAASNLRSGQAPCKHEGNTDDAAPSDQHRREP
eukprot:15430757-Alexandrium_andersonii.AAC.1